MPRRFFSRSRNLIAQFVVIILSAIPAIAADSAATTQLAATQPTVLKIAAHPAPIALPALRYRLIPTLAERTPGDAAPLYLMAFMLTNLTHDDQMQIDELLAAPIDKFSIEKAEKILQSRRASLASLELAGRRVTCNWNIPWREQGFATMLPHLNRCREATRLLALQTRLQIRQGRFDQALHTLQTGFAMVDHLKNEAVLIQGLIALATTHVLLDCVVELQQMPGSPNLYWAIADLPHPLVDARAMLELERALPLFTFMPELKGRSARELSADEFSAVLSRLSRTIASMSGQEVGAADKLALAASLAMQLGPARTWLQSHGYTEKQVSDMQPITAVGIYTIEIYQQTADDIAKWTSLPYWQARKGVADAALAMKALQRQGENWALSILPAIGTVLDRIAETDRRLAMLQIVEALRGYAAAHHGKLPNSLADLTETPTPTDPMTGHAFEYEVTGNTAILRSTAIPQTNATKEGIYRITILPGK